MLRFFLHPASNQHSICSTTVSSKPPFYKRHLQYLLPSIILKMKFFSIILALSAALIASATTVSVSYDPTYDTATTSMDSVACSDGSNGLITK